MAPCPPPSPARIAAPTASFSQPFGEGLVAGEEPPSRHAHYTNAELVDVYDPLSARLPYVWDDFGYAQCLSGAGRAPCTEETPCR